MGTFAGWVAAQLRTMETMQVTVGKRVLPLSDAPEIVQTRWLKERLREHEDALRPVKEEKAADDTPKQD